MFGGKAIWKMRSRTIQKTDRLPHLFRHIMRFTGLKTIMLTGDGIANYKLNEKMLEKMRKMAGLSGE
jgi:hypothetical protein